MSFCTLTLAFLCLLRGLSHPILLLTRIFRFSDPVSFKELTDRFFFKCSVCTEASSPFVLKHITSNIISLSSNFI